MPPRAHPCPWPARPSIIEEASTIRGKAQIFVWGSVTGHRSPYADRGRARAARHLDPRDVPHTRHLADPRRRILQRRDNRRSVACKSPGPAVFCLGVLGVVAGTGRLVEMAPRGEVQARVFGGRSRHWLGRWVEEVSGGGVGSVEVGAGRARGVGPRVGGRAA